jgi:hypothetical protein
MSCSKIKLLFALAIFGFSYAIEQYPYKCPDERPTMCTMEYIGVCGWKNNGSKVDSSTGCTACTDPSVYVVSLGSCEDQKEPPVIDDNVNDKPVPSQMPPKNDKPLPSGKPPKDEKPGQPLPPSTGDFPHKCQDSERDADCSKADGPAVCGYFNSNIMCFRAPCAREAKNVCEACADRNVDYAVLGSCEDELKKLNQKNLK